MRHRLLPAALVSCLMCACAHRTIPGTSVRDTKANRDVLKIVAELREGLQRRDVKAVLALVSPEFYEDMGTPDPKDDYGYTELKDKILPNTMALTHELYVAFDANDVFIEGNKAHADVRYFSRVRLKLPSGSQWDTHKEFNRISMVREGNAWKIISGL